MNTKLRLILKNSGYSILSNLLSLIVSTLVIMILPELIGSEAYGYWQLYLFYSTYIGFLHFGWIDGIYLKYGGKYYHQLDKQNFYSQFVYLSFSQFIVSLIVALLGWFIGGGTDKYFIFLMFAVTILLTNIRFFIVTIFQMTNEIKEASKIILSDRILYVCLLFLMLFIGIRDYQFMIYADIIGRFASLIYSIVLAKDIVWRKLGYAKLDYVEITDNIKIGSQLMLSNVASMLIIGIVRIGIERAWDVSTFGKISLSLSISNMIMLFINALGIVIFPVLKRLSQDRLISLYASLRDFLMLLMLASLLVYYPMKFILDGWLPTYSDGLKFMALLFPISIFEGKMSLLINTYLKIFRMEKQLLIINMIGMLFSCLSTLFTTVIYPNLLFAVLSILILIIFRCFLAELYLQSKVGTGLLKDLSIEIIMTVLFVVFSWFPIFRGGFVAYIITYIFYVTYKFSEIKNSINCIKLILSENR